MRREYQAPVSVKANFGAAEVKRSGRSQHHMLANGLNEQPTISAQAHLRQQVKPRSGGRSQNRRLAQGVPA